MCFLKKKLNDVVKIRSKAYIWWCMQTNGQIQRVIFEKVIANKLKIQNQLYIHTLRQ